MKIFFLPIFIVCSFSALMSQSYDGTIYLNNGKRIKAEIINIEQDVIQYHSDIFSSAKSIDKSEVRMLRVKDGNYAFEGLLLGSASGFLFYHLLVGFDQSSSTSTYYSLGIGALIGLAIGAATSGVKSIRINKSELSFLDFEYMKDTNNRYYFKLVNYTLNF